MPKRPTLADIARVAGVSTATVDRVINKRRPVKKTTEEAVLNASRRLNFGAASIPTNRMAEPLPERRLGFILQKALKPFYIRLSEAIRAAAESQRDVSCRAEILFVEELAPEPIVEKMKDLSRRVDSLAIVAVDHPLVSDEIWRLKQRGVPVWALLSDLSSPDKAGYIGIDGRKAGRTAAWAFDKHCSPGGTIGTLIGSQRYVGHEDRDTGLRAFFREKQRNFNVLEATSYLDSDDGAYKGTMELVARSPGLAGLHVIGGGCEGAIRALADKELIGKVALVCHELNSETRRGLIDGSTIMVLATPVERVAAAAVRLLAASEQGEEHAERFGPVLPFEILISENI